MGFAERGLHKGGSFFALHQRDSLPKTTTSKEQFNLAHSLRPSNSCEAGIVTFGQHTMAGAYDRESLSPCGKKQERVKVPIFPSRAHLQ